MNYSAARLAPHLAVPVSSSKPRARVAAQQRWFAPRKEACAEEVISAHFARARGRVRSFLVGQGVARADADDLCQEVYLVALKRFGTFQGLASLDTWILGIAVRIASDHRRCARVRYEALDGAVPDQPMQATQHDALERSQTAATLRAAVAGLKPPAGAVFRGYLLEGIPMKRLAPKQGIPLQTAYARFYAAQRVVSRALAIAES
jgi:RNA polymerase sigma-70 factor (ECF subfamily)